MGQIGTTSFILHWAAHQPALICEHPITESVNDMKFLYK